MNEKERARRRKIWEALTDSERDAVEQKRADIINWSIEAEEKALEKIKAEGRHTGGLDGKYPELEEISKETARRLGLLLKSIFDIETTSQ